MHIHMYAYICVYMYIHIYLSIYRERERKSWLKLGILQVSPKLIFTLSIIQGSGRYESVKISHSRMNKNVGDIRWHGDHGVEASRLSFVIVVALRFPEHGLPKHGWIKFPLETDAVTNFMQEPTSHLQISL